MICRYVLLIAVFLVAAVLAAGCTGNFSQGTVVPPPTTPVPAPSGTPAPVSTSYTPPEKITTTSELIAFVANAATFARENGREAAVAEFNDPNGSFVLGNTHVFAIGYNGTLIADAMEPENIGKGIQNLTDSFGTPIVQNLASTARSGRGYVSYTYPNPRKNNTIESRITVVEDVDGTYYVAAGMYASEGEVYPSTRLNISGDQPGVEDLVTYVKSAVAYARANGRAKALAVFNDPYGPFIQGELVLMAFDYNGTNLAGPPYSPELASYHINLLNYQDPDGVETIRGMRDIAREGGGFFYTVAKVEVDDKEVYVPKVDYAEPVDGDWWVFSGIIVPEYVYIGTGDLAGVQIRKHTREELFELVNRATDFARKNGRDLTIAEINDPAGQFVSGDLFVWAESSEGILLADPFWKSGIGKNQIDYADRNGMKITRVGISAMENGTGFSHGLFPNTAMNGTTEVPKLIYMKAVDDTWWIGSGIYGIEVK